MDQPMIDRSKYKYDPISYTDPKTGKKRRSLGNGDAVARAMLGLSADDLVTVCKANGLDELAAKKDAINPGQFRMMVGNALRGLVRKGTAVNVGDHEITSLSQKIALPEAPAAEEQDEVEKPKRQRSKKAA